MNPSERRRVVRRRHVIALAPVLLAGLTACADQPAAPSLTVDLQVEAPHSPVRSLHLVPSPRTTHKAKPAPTHKPKAPPKPHIGTALTIRRLRVTHYCFEGSPTSLGKPPWVGVAAVKKASGIPYGAHLVIAGKRYVVGDREPSFGVSDVDLYAGRGPSCEREASRFGIQHLPVQIERAA